MMGESYYSKPQREEYFTDSGYYKYHEAYHLLKFSNEKQILEKAYNEYLDLKKVTYGEHISILERIICMNGMRIFMSAIPLKAKSIE